MSYIMLKEAYLTVADDNNVGRLMFYTPPMGGAVWSAVPPNSPVMADPKLGGAPQPIDIFVVPGGWGRIERRGHSGSGRD